MGYSYLQASGATYFLKQLFYAKLFFPKKANRELLQKQNTGLEITLQTVFKPLIE
jgi:hypothetical protein